MPTKRTAQKRMGKKTKGRQRERENKTMLMPKGKRWVSYQGGPWRVQQDEEDERQE